MSVESRPLAGKVAIVTGSGRGMGAAELLRLAALGANVVVNYAHSASAAENVAKEARSRYGVDAITVQADVSKRADVTQLFTKAKQELGRVDVVMSNSGIEHFGKVDEVTEDQLDKVLAVNVKAQFFIAQEAFAHMEDNGRLIFISSVSAVLGFPRHAVYSLSKAAIQGMIKCLAWDFGTRGITVNCIAPGGVKTDMWTEAAKHYVKGGDKMTPDEVDAAISGTSPLGRPGYVDDIAKVVGFIASPDSQWMTGSTFHVSGGTFMSS